MDDEKKSLWEIVWSGFNRADSTITFLASIVKRICLILSFVFLGLFVYQVIVYMFSQNLELLKTFLYFIGFVFFLLFPYTSEFFITWKEEKVNILGREMTTRTGVLHIRGLPYTRDVFWLKLEYDLQRILIGFVFILVSVVLLGVAYMFINSIKNT